MGVYYVKERGLYRWEFMKDGKTYIGYEKTQALAQKAEDVKRKMLEAMRLAPPTIEKWIDRLAAMDPEYRLALEKLVFWDGGR